MNCFELSSSWPVEDTFVEKTVVIHWHLTHQLPPACADLCLQAEKLKASQAKRSPSATRSRNIQWVFELSPWIFGCQNMRREGWDSVQRLSFLQVQLHRGLESDKLSSHFKARVDSYLLSFSQSRQLDQPLSKSSRRFSHPRNVRLEVPEAPSPRTTLKCLS